MKFLKLFVNWIVFLTMPVWAGIAVMVSFSVDAWTRENSTPRNMLAGKDWFWRNL